MAPDLPTLINKITHMTATSASSIENTMLQNLLANSKLMLILAPLVILYVFAQNFFTQSIERSGITG